MEILEAPNPMLKTKADPVLDITPEILALLDEMTDTMFQANGQGLAATQIGVPRRVVVVDILLEGEQHPQLFGLINPVITAREGTQLVEEGCLSVPDLYVPVKRSLTVTVVAQDRHGAPVVITASGHTASVLQHEIEHLDGVTILKHATPPKRKRYLRDRKRR